MSDQRIATVQLHGRIFLEADIKMVTGLHIGGAAGGLEIGGVDKPVIRNPYTDQPYIPGSSLKGKLRSLLEKACGAPQNYPINKKTGVYVHIAENEDEYTRFPICSVFGTLPEWGPESKRHNFQTPTPTRLTVRDVPLTDVSAKRLKDLKTDLPYTEVKWEASIDRVTSAASPRQIERVPAGAVFGPANLIFSVYTGNGEHADTVARLFAHVVAAMQYLEDDYLGGMGTRGNGQVAFTKLNLTARRINKEKQGYEDEQAYPESLDNKGISQIDREQLSGWLTDIFNT